jgi:hypothetical protein
LGELSNAGFDASSAATATRNILLNLADSNGKLAKSLDKPVKDIPSLVAGLKQLNAEGIDLGAALELTDKRSVAAFATFLSGTDSVIKLNDTLENAAGTSKEMAGIMGDNLTGDTKKFTSAWEGLVLSLTKGDTLFSKLLRSIVQFGTAILSFLTPQKNMVESIEDENLELNILITQITNANIQGEERNRLMSELQKEYPAFLKNLDSETVTNQELATRLKEVNEQFQKRIVLAALEQETQKATEKAVKLLLKERELRKELAELEATGLDTRKDVNLLGEETTLGAKKQEEINEIMAERSEILDEQAKLQADLTAELSKFQQSNNDFFEESQEQTEEIEKTITKQKQSVDELLQHQLNAAKIALLGKTLSARQELDLQKELAKAERDVALAKSETTDEKELIEAQYLDKIGKLNKAFFDDENKQSKDLLNKRNENFQDSYEQDKKDHEESEKEKTRKAKEEEEKRLKNIEDTFAKIQAIYQSSADSIIGISNGISARRIQDYESELQALDEKTNKELELAEGNDAAQQRIQERAEKRRAVLEAQIKREKRKSARLEKAAAVIQTIINTAISITKTLATLGIPAGIPASILAGVLGTAQTAAIAAQPIPQFAKGTDSAPGGLAIVGERGQEIVREIGGRVSLTPDRPTLMNVPKGSEVIPHEETMRMLALSALGQETYTDREQARLISEIQDLKGTIKEYDSKIVKAIYANGGHLEKDGSILYRVTTDEQANRIRTRKSTMG